ncbi:ADP-ribose pyrophosphatase [Paenibacillus selenitireducens]|uniref:ADP-ribose pyrophosphatase n=1 Tax=Paenibacillus selenitireducens TaxID=1324314 RepID=A0A1T2WZ36_9BACL|nr:NUDIX domain-containing protein [Paenibacillus selenitireducens]OPA72887.1 ADP-ribose pyrophosphatase [Paenibacillus selenitireducens]
MSTQAHADEQAFLSTYDPTKYERPIGVPADIVIFTVTQEAVIGGTKSLPKRELCVLLIKRNGHPDRGKWALPGGFSSPQETLLQAAKRELLEETGVADIHLELLGIYDQPGRDKRGWVISAAHVALVNERYLSKRQAADDAEDVQLFTIEEALELDLAFDHRLILEDAQRYVRCQMLQTTVAKEFLDEKFTLAELLQVIQTVVPSYEITKTNFIRKMLMTKKQPIVEAVEGEFSTEYSQRPAQLYRFIKGYQPNVSIYVDAPFAE